MERHNFFYGFTYRWPTKLSRCFSSSNHKNSCVMFAPFPTNIQVHKSHVINNTSKDILGYNALPNFVSFQIFTNNPSGYACTVNYPNTSLYILLNYMLRICNSKTKLQGMSHTLPQRKDNVWDCSLLFHKLIPNFLVILCHERGELKSLTSTQCVDILSQSSV